MSNSSPMIGSGLDLGQVAGLDAGAWDYFGNRLGNGVDGGYNLGADGAK